MTRQQAIIRFREAAKNVRTSTTILLWVFSLSAIGLFVASFIVPPTGEIHASVLKAGAEIFGLLAIVELREAYLEGLGVKVTHGTTTIEVKDQDGHAEAEEAEGLRNNSNTEGDGDTD